MKIKHLTTVLGTAAFLGACATTPSTGPAAQPSLPDWVTNPLVEGGLADTQCVQVNADMNILKNKATTLARAEIAKQINLKVKVMDKSYQSLTDTAEGSSAGGTFESVSKQLADQALAGSRPIKVDYVNFPDNTQKLCVMVALNPAATETLYKTLVKESSRQLSPQHDAVLFQEFKAHKAQQELEMELQRQGG